MMKEQDSPEEQIRKAKERKRELLARKKKVKMMEEENEDKLIFFRQKNDYWHLGGVSAEIYAYVIAKRYKRNARIIEDPMKEYNFPGGVVAIRANTMMQMLTMLAGDDAIVEKKGEDLIVVRLPERFSKEHLRVLKQAKAEQIKRLTEKVIPTVILPKTLMVAEDFARKVAAVENKARGEMHKMSCANLRKLAYSIVLMIIRGSSEGDKTAVQMKKEIMEVVKKIYQHLTVMLLICKADFDDAAGMIMLLANLEEALSIDVQNQEEYEKRKKKKLAGRDEV